MVGIMHTRKIFIAVTLLIAAAIVSLGCYTIIRHPEVQSSRASVDSESYAHSDQDRDCMRCHQDYSEYPYGYYYSDYYPDYYWTHPRWGSYYAYPWWWDHYWYKDNYDFEPIPGDYESGDRPDRRRQGMTPPYTRGVDPSFPPPPPPSFNPGTSGGGSGGSATGGNSGGGNSGSSGEEEKKEEKPPKRRGGKGGGGN
jgi:uncharacterized membrane protein YgcG